MNMRDAALEAWQEEFAERERVARERFDELSSQTRDRFHRHFTEFVQEAEVSGRMVTIGDLQLFADKDGFWVVVERCPDCGQLVHGGVHFLDLKTLGETLDRYRSEGWPYGFYHECPAREYPPEPPEPLERIAAALERIAARLGEGE